MIIKEQYIEKPEFKNPQSFSQLKNIPFNNVQKSFLINNPKGFEVQNFSNIQLNRNSQILTQNIQKMPLLSERKPV